MQRHRFYRIKRRCGRHVQELDVKLTKPPEEFTVGETFTVTIHGPMVREVELRVEIECSENEDGLLYVA